jgi:hypothetical protein
MLLSLTPVSQNIFHPVSSPLGIDETDVFQLLGHNMKRNIFLYNILLNEMLNLIFREISIKTFFNDFLFTKPKKTVIFV